MITPEQNTALNEVITLFSQVGYNLCSAKYAFRESGYNGFKRMVKNEEKERWELQDELIKTVYELGGKVEFAGIPAVTAQWTDPASAITTLVKHDDMLIAKIETACYCYEITKILHHLREERNELADVLKEISNAKGDFYAVDQSLHERYKKTHCRCSKY